MAHSGTMYTQVNNFLRHLDMELGRKPTTIENYGRYLRNFMHATAVFDAEDITIETVERFERTFMDAKRHEKVKSLKTLNYHLTAVRKLLSYMKKNGVTSLDPDKVRLKKTKERAHSVLKDEEFFRMLRELHGTDQKSLRDRALIYLLFSTGIKVSEACGLDRSDIAKTGMCTVGVGDSFRQIFLDLETMRHIHTYVHVRIDKDPALFVNNGKRTSEHGSTRLTPRSVERIVRQSAVCAGIPKSVTPSTLRHAFAQRSAHGGASLHAIKKLLGHKNSDTTKAYLRKLP